MPACTDRVPKAFQADAPGIAYPFVSELVPGPKVAPLVSNSLMDTIDEFAKVADSLPSLRLPRRVSQRTQEIVGLYVYLPAYGIADMEALKNTLEGLASAMERDYLGLVFMPVTPPYPHLGDWVDVSTFDKVRSQWLWTMSMHDVSRSSRTVGD
eukprot:scaffold1629_cov369-Prasinococcus_capsulatus_cf.AAC.25